MTTAAARLRALDDRVLGRPKPVTAPQQRTNFLIGLVGTAVTVGTILLIGEPGYLGAAGGFVGVTIGGGVRWRRLVKAQRR